MRGVNRRSVLQLAALALVVFGTSSSDRVEAQVADGVVAIIHARNPTQTINKADLKKLFLGQTGFWHGVVPVRVFVRPDDSGSAKLFYRTVLDMTPQAFRKHWDKQQLSGRAVAPESVSSIEDIAKKVGGVPGGVGFALSSETWSLKATNVKIIPLK